jgi:RNA polymerase-binding transcription factor
MLGTPSRISLDFESLPVDKGRTAKFEAILTKKREELRHNLGRTQEQRDEAHDFGRDEGDRATASMSKEMSFRQKAQERGLLLLVEAALGRINGGTFGECLNCGQEIGANRLNAVPWSRYCITCQELIAEQA